MSLNLDINPLFGRVDMNLCDVRKHGKVNRKVRATVVLLRYVEFAQCIGRFQRIAVAKQMCFPIKLPLEQRIHAAYIEIPSDCWPRPGIDSTQTRVPPLNVPIAL